MADDRLQDTTTYSSDGGQGGCGRIQETQGAMRIDYIIQTIVAAICVAMLVSINLLII